MFSCVQPTLFSRLSWGSTDDQCRYRGLRDILCVTSRVQPTLFSRLSWGSTDDQCRYRILSARRPLPVDLLRFTNAGQRKIGKIAPKSSKSPLTWVGRCNEVDRNPRYLYATRTVHVKGFARPPGYMRPPNAQAAGSSSLESLISLGFLCCPQTPYHTPDVIRC